MSIAAPKSLLMYNPQMPQATAVPANEAPPPYQRIAPNPTLSPQLPLYQPTDQFNPALPQTPPPPYQRIAPVLPAPVQAAWPQIPPPAYQPVGAFTLDEFQRRLTQPVIYLDPMQKFSLRTLHPLEFHEFQKMNATSPLPEGLDETLYMYDRVYQELNPSNRARLKELLQKGMLQNSKAEDNHTFLYHLYGMLTTRRATGYKAPELLNETVDILSRPYAITQKFGPLSEGTIQKILMVRNYPESNRAGVAPPSKLLTRSDLEVQDSGTCVASSVMYYMAEKEPAELVRHLNELTSPLNAFFEKVKLNEIAPDNPNEALETLRQSQIPYTFIGPGEVRVKVNLPPAGMLRAIDGQYAPSDHSYRNAIEVAYQSALTFLADHTYDPATDIEDAGPGEESGKGLTEPKKTLMETIIKENGGVQSVTYQAVDSKANPAQGEENNSYLYGYNRSFEQTTNDIIQSLRMGEPVVVGTTDTDETGAIVTGHEITITGAKNDPITNELLFMVADSDDQNPKLVVRTARELIPTIHHAGLPLHLAQRINQEIAATPGVLIPDSNDASHFKLLQQQTGPMPSLMQQPETQAVAQQSSPVLPWGVPPQQPAPVLPWATPTPSQPSVASMPAAAIPANMQTGNYVPANNPFKVRPTNGFPVAVQGIA